jgi:hypothetical protein
MSFTRGKVYFSDTSAIVRDAAMETCVAELAELGIAGATMYQTDGIWNGETEFGFVLEVLNPLDGTVTLDGGSAASSPTRYQLTELAQVLRIKYQQTSVLVTVEVVEGDAIFVEETNR